MAGEVFSAGMDVPVQAFRGWYPVFWRPPMVRDWPLFDIDGECAVEVVKPGGCALVHARRKLIVLFNGGLPGFVCDGASVSDFAARTQGIFKSDIKPQDIWHDTAYRRGLRDYAWALPWKRFGASGLEDAAEMAKDFARDKHWTSWHEYGFPHAADSPVFDEWRPTQRDADDIFRVLMINYNDKILSDRKAIKSWLAVRIFGGRSFRDAKQAKKCEAVRDKIQHYLRGKR